SLSESGALLANFGVQVAAGDLALLHQRSEGWAAALQMAALRLRGTTDPAQVARALDVRSHAIAEYFVSEVLEQQPPEVARFMLETSVLDELTAEACAEVTGREDAAAVGGLDLSTVDPSLLTGAPERLLAIAADLLLWGDWVRGGEYLDLVERTQPAIAPDSRLAARLAAMRSLRHGLTGDLDEAVRQALAARSIEQTMPADELNATVPLILLRAYRLLEDFGAVDREVAAALAIPSLAEPARLVALRGAQALAWFDAGHLAQAADAAQ